MTNTTNNPTCPKCGAPIPAEAPGGLCPKCVLEGAATTTSSAPATGGRRSAPPTVAEIAPHFPELEILELVGAGGMGAVYKARQPQLDRTVALKILSHDLAADPAFAERFNREARVLAKLSHPNIVGVFDFGTAGPHCYLLMEYVDGVNLRQAMQTGGFTPAESLALVEDICAALKFAHEEGILHRDIKPENVLIDAKGRVKIADFGIAKLLGEGPSSDVTLTLEGSILGSPHYMAPEQIETPSDVDQRADIYSLGVVLYEMLTGELPLGRFALPSQKAAMDARIDAIVLRTLEKEREARFQSAEEVSTSVGALAQSPPVPSPTPATGPTAERPTAKFSLTSAVLTGASLLLGVVFLWGYFSNREVMVSNATPPREVAEGISARLPMMVLMTLVAVAFVATALMGFILGCRALGDIRESGGRKRGLGFAAFGTLAWPVWFLFVLALVTTNFAPDRAGMSISWPLLKPLVLLSGLIAAVLLVRGVVRWAGGVEDKGGQRRHPGFGRSLILALGIAVLLPALGIGIMTAAAGNSGEEDHRDAFRREVGSAAPQMVVTGDIRWRLGQPEVTLPLFLQPDQKAALRVFFRNAEGDIRNIHAGEAHHRPGAPDTPTTIEIGTELLGHLHRLVVIKSVPEGKSIRSLEDLRDFRFIRDLPDELRYDAPGTYTLELAALPGKDEETPEETLLLEVVVTNTNP